MQEEIHLRDYLGVLLKRKNSFLTFFIVLVVAATIGTFSSTPIYKASTRVLIEKENSNIVNLRDMYYESMYQEDYYQTQYELIRSLAVASRVVKNLNLDMNPAFNPALNKPKEGIFSGVKEVIHNIFPKPRKGPVEEAPPNPQSLSLAIAKGIQGGVRVEPVKNSRMVNIGFESSDPSTAATIADAVANAYIDIVLDIKMGTAKQAVEWMTKKIDEQKVKLDESQKSLQEYIKDKDIVALESKESAAPTKLQSLSAQLISAETRRRDAEALYNQVRDFGGNPQGALSIPAIASDPVIQTLRTEEIRLEKDVLEMSKRFGEKHPQMVRVKEDLRAVREKIAAETKRAVSSIKNEYELSRAKEAGLRNQYAQGKGEAITLSEKGVQYGILKREVETNQQMYEALLKKIKETSLVEEVKSFNIYIVDRAEVPRGPIRPRKMFNILLSVVAGLFGGIGIAFFIEYIDNTFKSPDDIEKKLDLPLLGVVPVIKKSDVGEGVKIETYAHTHQKSNISEAYKALRTSLLLSSVDPVKSQVVTSVIEGEGKTTTAINLAITLAHLEKRVLLVDADLRKPRVHSIFGMTNIQGLSSYLTADQDIEKIIRASGMPNLSVLTSGPIPPNPSELLSSEKMKRFLEVVTREFDTVILDSAPLVTVTDTIIISGLVDGTILVVRSGSTTFDIAKRGVKLLKDANSRIFGAVLNALDTERHGYRYMYPYYHYYQYGYGYGSEKKKALKGKG